MKLGLATPDEIRIGTQEVSAVYLGGNEVWSGDKLSLDLNFLEDKSIIARKGPTPFYGCASGATYVDSDMVIRRARENLLPLATGGASVTTSGFTRATLPGLDPEGDTTAEITTTSTGGQIRIENSPNPNPWDSWKKFSVWVKVEGYATRPEYLHLVYGDEARVSFHTETWATTTWSGGIPSIEHGPDGWKKLTMVIPPSSSARGYKLVFTQGNYYGNTVPVGTKFAVGSRQVTRKLDDSFHLLKTDAVPRSVPRFDHDPSTGEYLGVLLEDAKTNLCQYSENFGAVPWNSGGGRSFDVELAAGTAPDGEMTANHLVERDAAGTKEGLQTTPTLVSGTWYTFSCFVKAGARNQVRLYAGTYSVLPMEATFLLTGEGSIVSNTQGVARITRYGNDGWYRCSVSGLSGGGITSTRITLVKNGSNSYAGTPGEGLYAWGAQLEATPIATSYIPTVSGTHARAVSLLEFTGAAFAELFDHTEGSFAADFLLENTGGYLALGMVGYDSASRPDGGYSVTQNGFQIRVTYSKGPPNYTTQAQLLYSMSAPHIRRRISVASSFKQDDFRGAINGSLLPPDNQGDLPDSPIVALTLGRNGRTSGPQACFVWFRSFRHYKKSLPNAKLAALTTL